MKVSVREILITAVLALFIFLTIQATLQSAVVVGLSMEPSLQLGQRLLVSKVSYYVGDPKRGDVIVFQPMVDSAEDWVKRVIGLPGDTVEVKNSQVYVNDVALDEPYIPEPPAYSLDKVTVPANSYFVLGDNRNASNDSHNGWFVPHQNIIGKVWVSLWTER
ncbi:MAG: signal peptidase I [Chloroflexi bacterium]|nr:signal peptidase I [Chloroflexota bacterium]